MGQNDQKKAAAHAAIEYVKDNTFVGVGTGSTVNFFIDALSTIKHRIEGVVSSSIASTQRLKQHSIPVFDLGAVTELPIYVDGADEADRYLNLIKGGGGALTQEKIIAAVAQEFICIIDDSKQVDCLGQFPLPIEVIPSARSHVAREVVRHHGGDPHYREGFITDNGNMIIDVHNLKIPQPATLEQKLNNIVGVVSVGLFAQRGADVLLTASATGVETTRR